MNALKLQRLAVLSLVATYNSSAVATPSDIAMSHNFGRFVESCGQFDLQIAFARGQVTVQAPRTPEHNSKRIQTPPISTP
jgi:hypothetical protein